MGRSVFLGHRSARRCASKPPESPRFNRKTFTTTPLREGQFAHFLGEMPPRNKNHIQSFKQTYILENCRRAWQNRAVLRCGSTPATGRLPVPMRLSPHTPQGLPSGDQPSSLDRRENARAVKNAFYRIRLAGHRRFSRVCSRPLWSSQGHLWECSRPSCRESRPSGSAARAPEYR